MILFSPSLYVGDTKDTFNFFQKYKNDGEYLGLSTFHINQLSSTQPLDIIFESLFRFLDFSKYNDYYEEENDYWRGNVEMLPKFFWLSDEYLDNNYKFDNFLGVHWHTREKTWVVHPGVMRFNVIRFFSKQDYLKCITFNTGGFDHNFEVRFNNYGDIENYFYDKRLTLELVPDQGSLIPHLSIEKEIINGSVSRYFDLLNKFFSSTVIKTNSKNEIFKAINSFNKDFKKKEERIFFKNNPTTEDIFKSLIFLIKRKNYEPEKFVLKY